MILTKKEITIIKNNAVDYAKRFLAHKYNTEFAELYEAYCNNRGVETSRSSRIPPVDERLLRKE